jgi:hypothetical protein
MPISAIGSVTSTPASHAIASRPRTEASTSSSASGGFSATKSVISRVSLTIGSEIRTRYSYSDGTTEEIISRAPLHSQTLRTYSSKGRLGGGHNAS